MEQKKCCVYSFFFSVYTDRIFGKMPSISLDKPLNKLLSKPKIKDLFSKKALDWNRIPPNRKNTNNK